MTDRVSFWERIGFRSVGGIAEAGWGRTLVVAVVSFIYFLPVLFIIFTAIKPQALALSVPPTLSPTSFFGLIPDQFVFTPTLDNFASVFSRVMTAGGQPESTGFDRFFFNSIVIASASVLLGRSNISAVPTPARRADSATVSARATIPISSSF